MSVELAERTDGDVLVRLLWSGDEDAVHVEYVDLHTGEAFRSPVPKAEALEAFHHPHAYRRAAAAPACDPPPRRFAPAVHGIWESRHGIDAG